MMVLLWDLAAESKAPMIDFLMVNLFTESGGLVEILSWETMDGFLYLRFERVVTVF
jgi:hypothetical protein